MVESGGLVETPWVIVEDYDTSIMAPGAIWINNGYRDDTFSDTPQFDRGSIAESFVAEVVDDDCLDVPAFLGLLRAGQAVLRPQARSLAEREPELNLADRRFTEFPAGILTMPWLRTLILDGNPIGLLPDGIGALAALEHLAVRGCDLAEVPASICDLSALRVLQVAYNRKLTGLPDTLGQLTGLAELDVSGLSGEFDGADDPQPGCSPFALPESAGGLTNLRHLDAERTNLVVPASMHGLPRLEKVSMGGVSWGYLRQFPEWVTTLPRLRQLDLSGNYFARGSLHAARPHPARPAR